MKLRSILISLVLLCSFAAAQDQPKKMVSVPEDQLTEQQKQALKIQQVDTTIQSAHGWVGVGKELGTAFDSALQSLTQRSNEFAQTKVGKFTMILVAWKVMGEDAKQFANAIVHFAYGFIELVVFLPILLWNYRRSCITRKILVSKEGPFWARKKTYQVFNPQKEDEDTYRARSIVSLVLFLVFVFVFLVTVFSY